MELILIRHLPTEWNLQEVLQGSKDIPILPISTDEEKHIKQVSVDFASFKPDVVLASELQRTKQTAAHYGFHEPIIEPLLNELNFGIYEGMPKKELLAIPAWTENPKSLILGERMVDFEQRIYQFIDKYKHVSKVLAFGHGSWIRGIISIKRFGDIQAMNKMTVKNNEMLTLHFSKDFTQVK